MQTCARQGKIYYGYVGAQDGEDFSRMLRAAQKPDGTNALLLCASCPCESQEQVIGARRRTAAGVPVCEEGGKGHEVFFSGDMENVL